MNHWQENTEMQQTTNKPRAKTRKSQASSVLVWTKWDKNNFLDWSHQVGEDRYLPSLSEPLQGFSRICIFWTLRIKAKHFSLWKRKKKTHTVWPINSCFSSAETVRQHQPVSMGNLLYLPTSSLVNKGLSACCCNRIQQKRSGIFLPILAPLWNVCCLFTFKVTS